VRFRRARCSNPWEAPMTTRNIGIAAIAVVVIIVVIVLLV
jgi:hypothetical protein